MSKKMLLLSNSTTFGYGWLEHAEKDIIEFLGNNISEILFIPFAGVTISYNDYAEKTKEKFAQLGYKVKSIHEFDDYKQAVLEAEAIAVGGGNTFSLLKALYDYDLINAIKNKVTIGIPYIGWSAGSNMVCPSIKTTNDMPITEPKSFKALNLISFQINPHYTEGMIPNHNGETREQRILEFLEASKDIYVVGLREGSTLSCTDKTLKLIGDKPMRVFKYNQETLEFNPGDNIDFLIK
ncbi:MAG: dipeptidase PepE [bacterium]